MAVPNVDKITSTLARLPDQALQQYAAMHKNDPYIMSLAMSESNRRKELRAAAQAPQGMQEQPKVVDAALAQMAPPQEQGIAALPAPNMQMMADGGIAGYEGYGEGDESYGQEPVMMMAGGGAVERYNGQAGSLTGDIPGFVAGTGNFIPQQGAPEEVPLFRRMFRDARATGASYQIEQAKARIAAGVGTSADEAILAAAQSEQNKGPSAQDMAMFDAASNLYMTERANKQAADKPAAGPTPPAADKKGGAAPRPGTGAGPAAAAAAPEQSVTDRYAAMQKAMGLDDTSKVDTERQALYDAMRAQDKNALEEFEKDVAARGEAFKGREERLAKREADLGKRKDENTGLALLEAGLSIMSTPGKLAEAVGKGAQVGLRSYSAGLKDLRAAQEKLDDARDQIEEYRRNEANMTAKERRQFKNQIGRTETDIKRLGLDAAEKMTGEKRSDLRTLFTAEQQTILTDKEIKAKKDIAAMQERGANARAGRNQQLEVLEAVSKDPALAAAYKSMHGKGVDVMGEYNDFLKANPTLALDPKAAMTQFLMTKSVFSQLGTPTITDKPSTKLRTQP